MNYWFVFLIFVPIGVFCFGRTLNIAYETESTFLMIKKLVLDFFAMNGYASYNITWWFNSLIIKLYILFPLFYCILSAKRYWLTALILLTVYYFDSTTFPFLLGMVMVIYSTEIEKFIKKANINCLGLVSMILMVFLILCRQFSHIPKFNGGYLDGLIALFIAISVSFLTQKLNYSFPVLKFLGKHSMNMYLIHTFIFCYFFHDFIYGFGNPLIIFLVLLATSLLTSIAIEGLKRVTKYDKLISKLPSVRI